MGKDALQGKTILAKTSPETLIRARGPAVPGIPVNEGKEMRRMVFTLEANTGYFKS